MTVLEKLKLKTVLYAEDDDISRETLGFVLRHYVKSVITAKDGQEALELYKKYAPDIVLTDLEMPKMSGIALSQEIKKIKSDTPVVVITSFEDEAHLAKHTDATIIKPLKKDVLIETLGKMI